MDIVVAGPEDMAADMAPVIAAMEDAGEIVDKADDSASLLVNQGRFAL